MRGASRLAIVCGAGPRPFSTGRADSARPRSRSPAAAGPARRRRPVLVGWAGEEFASHSFQQRFPPLVMDLLGSGKEHPDGRTLSPRLCV